MLNSGQQRVLVLHGETPSRFTSPDDRGTSLLFGDAGSATALERKEGAPAWSFNLQSDGAGYSDLIIPAGGFRQPKTDVERDYYLHMNGAGLFNFTIERVPPLIAETLALTNTKVDDVDFFIFHQSNQFMMKHLAKKAGLSIERTPIILQQFGNTGGPSVALTITQTLPPSEQRNAQTSLMLLGYGVGLSWAAAQVRVDNAMLVSHSEISAPCVSVHRYSE